MVLSPTQFTYVPKCVSKFKIACCSINYVTVNNSYTVTGMGLTIHTYTVSQYYINMNVYTAVETMHFKIKMYVAILATKPSRNVFNKQF